MYAGKLSTIWHRYNKNQGVVFMKHIDYTKGDNDVICYHSLSQHCQLHVAGQQVLRDIWVVLSC